ncbi:transposable element Tcb1 transposase [Trichonephila clavipes]|nr:transposable element Tcb1 transposase [Trichonephila clavipes]
MNCLTACQTFPWSDRSPDLSPIKHVGDIMGRQLHLTGNVHDLARQLEKICQEIPQEMTRVLYHSIVRRRKACIQARGDEETRERSPALDGENMRGEPWLERTGRER